MTRTANPNRGDVVVLVGTRKGAFLFFAGTDRDVWGMSGPHWPGSDVYHATYDDRGDGYVFVAVNDPIFGPQIHRSADFGASWVSPDKGPAIDSANAFSLNRLWQIAPGSEAQDGLVLAGGEPASLFVSEDDGSTWRELPAITHHETRDRWAAGFGGMCLHSIVVDPQDPNRLAIGISAAGVFGSLDGGESWEPMNRGVRADFMPERFPVLGQCPHRLLATASVPRRLYQQNHCGVYRSDNSGESWIDISDGLPSRFGLPLALHPNDPDTLYVLPEDKAIGDDVGGGVRYVTDSQFRVFRSRDAGVSWEPLTDGLPQHNAYLHAMRDAMAADALEPSGVYVGTSTGQLYHSADEGDHWHLLADLLPPINSVETATIN